MNRHINPTAIIFSLTMLLFAARISAQTPLHFDLLTNPLGWTEKTPNLCLQIQGSRYLPKFSVCASLRAQALRTPANALVRDVFSTGYTAEIRFYPFAHAPVLHKSYRMKTHKKSGCPSTNFALEPAPPLQSVLSGLYIAPGIQRLKTDVALYRTGSSTTSADLYTASIWEKSYTLHAGYNYRIKFITLGIAYGYQIGRPVLNDPWRLVDTSIYSVVYPTHFRFAQGIRLEVGVNW